MKDSALSLSEAAKILSIHKQSLYNLRKQGKIKAVRVSERRTVILRSELDRYLKSLQNQE